MDNSTSIRRHLAAAATNVAERLGYINVFPNQRPYRNDPSLARIGYVQLRSNILQNILLDTLPGATPGTTFHPLPGI